jgi:hypothetical protein
MHPLTKTLFLVSITLSIIGCPSTGTNANLKGNELQLKAPTTESSTLEYFDSKAFENTLSTNMKGKHAQIEVVFLTPFSSTNVPSRMDSWLTAIGNTGGEVKMEPAEGERDIIGLIVSLYAVYQEVQNILRYLPARHYNAKLLYRQDESGEAMIKQIVFTRRN